MKKAKPHKAGYLWGGASSQTTKRKPNQYSNSMTKQDLINAIRKRKAKSI